RARDGGRHDRFPHRLGAAQRALQQAARVLVVVVVRGAEPALEVVVVLAQKGVADHEPASSGGENGRSFFSEGMACRVETTSSRFRSAMITPGSSPAASARMRPQGSMAMEWPQVPRPSS